MAAAVTDERVRSWLAQSAAPRTEDLPAPLQSRWTDASTLPSRPLPRDAIDAAVREETTAFAAIFGAPARVVVPPTFVWDDRVEQAWAATGVEVVGDTGSVDMEGATLLADSIARARRSTMAILVPKSDRGARRLLRTGVRDRAERGVELW
jgi:hypothetical protein